MGDGYRDLDGTIGLVVRLTLVFRLCFKEKLEEDENKWKRN